MEREDEWEVLISVYVTLTGYPGIILAHGSDIKGIKVHQIFSSDVGEVRS